MIQITFTPETPEQAALLGGVMSEYLRAAQAAAPTINEQQAKDLADAAANRADDAAREALQAGRAAKKPRVPKAAATSTLQPGAVTSETAAASDTADEGNAAAASSEPEAPAASAASLSAPVVSLEVVRDKLAKLSQAGKGPEVKNLIGKFGATKLTDIPSEKYVELLAAAEEL
jgi:hypothetical protein